MTQGTRRFSSGGTVYVGIVATLGISVLVHSIYTVATQGLGYQWFILAGLTLLSGSFTIRIPSIPARLSVSETFVFASAMLFGPSAATIVVVLDTLVISFWLSKASRRPLRIIFNMAAPAIAIWAASHVFFQLTNIAPLSVTPQPTLSLVVPVLTVAVLYFLLNSWLIALAVSFEKGVSAFGIWRNNFLWLSLNYFSGASVAVLLMPYLQGDHAAFLRVAGLLLPLLLISYLTFKTALGRVEDANKHLSELNRLYLSTIETLAMAIDAKDQITHGHIRRVQQYAVALAQRVGVNDTSQIRAIEAASLLHDMGKLAIPEYILNKPGKLTPAEFEKMKLHASVGADLLAAIDFPYPVVPIVRHHHESWDGSGYPDGLSGSDIPIGARILSVVDCFDALTSDRPYRPRLSDAEAIQILLDRKGSMYDPLIVDTFLELHQELSPRLQKSDLPSSYSRQISLEPEGLHSDSGLNEISASTEETLLLLDLARTLNATASLADIAEMVAQHLRRAVPASCCVFYVYDTASDELIGTYAVGEHATHVKGLRIPRGRRLTGWVAANRQTILNSDPVLDLGETARRLRPRFRSSLSTPLVSENVLVGVLTVYSVEPQAFTEDHRHISEAVARQVSSAFRNTLPDVTQAEHFRVEKSGERPSGHSNVLKQDSEFSIIVIKMTEMREGRKHTISSSYFEVAESIRHAIEDVGVAFPYDDGELVVILSRATLEDAIRQSGNVVKRLRHLQTLTTNRSLALWQISIGVGTSWSDGPGLTAVVEAAKRRARVIDEGGSAGTAVH